MQESTIEKWLVREVRKLGGIADKFTSPGSPGVPDRIIVMPGGKIYFVELKAETGRLSDIQIYQRKRYREVGADVRVIKGMDQAREFIEEVANGRRN